MLSQAAADAANPAVCFGLRKVMQPIILRHGSTNPFGIFIAILPERQTTAYPDHIFVRRFILPVKLYPAAFPKSCGRP